MKYRSTRGDMKELTGAQAVIKGLADDKGLFVPAEMPTLPFDLEEMCGKSYQEVAKAVIGSFFDDYTDEELDRCICGAYDDKFQRPEIAPIVKAGDGYFLELYHGKTAAFKDMALSILPYLLTTAMKKEKEDKKICILTATSGDTGKAALEGFADVEGTEILVFYPEEGVSQVQKQQMVTQEGANTHVYAIEGNFDDAQTGVKMIFNDDELAEALAQKGVKLSSANSINIGRLVPQVAYYVYSYLKLMEEGVLKPGEKLNVVVPTGNFGNILAAYYAKLMGLPLGRFICASNENKVLTDFLRTGTYDIHRDFHLTNSPSMDILISSNLERLLYELSGRDSGAIKALMEALEKDGKYSLPAEMREKLADFYGGFATEEETLATIGKIYGENGYLMDTHTAVAYKVYCDYKAETGDETPTLIVSTASPYKFAEAVSGAIGLPEEANGFEYVKALERSTNVETPSGLRDLENRPVRHFETFSPLLMKSAVVKMIQNEV